MLGAAGFDGAAAADNADAEGDAACVLVAATLSGEAVAMDGSATSAPVPHAVSRAATVRTPGTNKLLFMLFECTEPPHPGGALQWHQ